MNIKNGTFMLKKGWAAYISDPLELFNEERRRK